jgi:hypothetical protein
VLKDKNQKIIIKIFMANFIILFTLHSISFNNTFKKNIQTILKIIKNNDIKAFLKISSKRGIICVERYRYWNKVNNRRYMLFVPQRKNFVYIEEVLIFERNELTSQSFATVLNRFSEIVNGTYAGPWWSLNMFDANNMRYLGPAIMGKVASNEYWYIYLHYENKCWKVWRLELDITH